jgi:bacteriophage HK97-gp10 putative tail-component
VPVDDTKLQAALSALAGRINVASAKIVNKSALAVQATGMPYTPVEKGTLRRSWRVEPATTGTGVFAAKVGPSVVYARRIELGFYDRTDSLGRHFMQRGKPYVKKAYTTVVPRMRSYAQTIMGKALRG